MGTAGQGISTSAKLSSNLFSHRIYYVLAVFVRLRRDDVDTKREKLWREEKKVVSEWWTGMGRSDANNRLRA